MEIMIYLFVSQWGRVWGMEEYLKIRRLKGLGHNFPRHLSKTLMHGVLKRRHYTGLNTHVQQMHSIATVLKLKTTETPGGQKVAYRKSQIHICLQCAACGQNESFITYSTIIFQIYADAEEAATWQCYWIQCILLHFMYFLREIDKKHNY